MKDHFYQTLGILISLKRDIPKAVKIANYLITIHNKHANGMEELVKNWNTNSKDLGLEIASVHRDVAKCIEEIVKALQPIAPKEKKLVKVIA